MRKSWVVAFSLLTVLSVAVYFRAYPIFLPQLRISAEMNVDRQINRKIIDDTNKQYPNLDNLAKSRLFERELAGYKKQNKDSIKKMIREEFDKIKDRFQDRAGQTYLMELDGWHFSRYVKNIINSGHPGDEMRYAKEYDMLMLFPDGNDIGCQNLLFYLSAFSYKLFNWLFPITVDHFLLYLPLFFSLIFFALLYSFCYRNWGNLVAMICSVFVSSAPIFLPRSCAGWFDMDVLNMIFPVLIVWTYILAYNTSSWKKSFFWVILSAFWVGMFCATWVAWSFILFVIIFYELIVVANAIAERLQFGEDTSAEIKKHLVISGVFFLFSLFWIVMLVGADPLINLFSIQLKMILNLNNPMTSIIWPNVYSTVGELKSGDYLAVAKSVGGIATFVLTLMSMLGLFLRIKKYQGMKRELLIIMMVWFMLIFFFCSKGIRFAMFLLVPLGVFLAWGIDEVYRFVLKRDWKLAFIPLTIAVVLLLNSFISNADSNAKSCLPLMEDTWYYALNTVKKYTPVDSVINSWWDYGDWFKAVADRRIIFDGQSQNLPQAYWMARVLLTDSEAEAVGILRMLNNGGNKAFEIIEKKVSNPFRSVSLLKKAILLAPEEGRAFLSGYLSAQELDEVCRIIYSPAQQKVYFIVDSSMIGKITPISFLGNWDFVKVYLSRVIRVKPKDQVMRDLLFYGLDSDQAEKYYQEALFINRGDFNSWVSRRMSINGIAYQKKSEDGLVLFNNGYIFNPARKTIYSYSSYEERYRVPKSLFLVEDGKIKEETLAQSDINLSAMILKDSDMYKLILLSPEIARSMFVRLQFLNGKGLEHFVPFLREAIDGNQIFVYEVK